MRSLVATLLIFFLLMGQSIAAAPHLHWESSDVHPVKHTARSHVHWHATTHHAGDHGHKQQDVPKSRLANEHDDDAIYVGAFDLVSISSSTFPSGLATVWANIPESLTTLTFVEGTSCGRNLERFQYFTRPKCARFEQLLSIRC